MGDRVKTGEARKSDQPFNIDRLPDDVKEAIQDLRRLNGRTWIQIEEQSALPFNPKWRTKGGGFVNWHDLPLSVLDLFPDMRIPKSSLHRWYDVRIKQAQEAVMERAAQARILAESFAEGVSDESRTAALNAATDILFGLMSEDTSISARVGAVKGLLKIAEVQQKDRTNDIRERKVSVEERRIAQLEKDAELKRKRFQQEMDSAEKKIKKGEPISVDDINQIRQRVFGLGPVPKEEAVNG